ncbi:MAG: SCP2 sterol-binding domain-containing protein [Actinomycetota bacterium]|nr:SCP2 sterol-binding domain-containing protein [Actinomycetota bacterium]
MALFENIETFYECIQELFKRLTEDPKIKKKALNSKLIVNFVYRNPDGEVWIDCTGDEVVVLPGKQDMTADATLKMETDVANKFWLGKLNLIKSLTSGEIESKGSVPKMLKLLPVIKPAFKIYPQILKEKGLERMIQVE